MPSRYEPCGLGQLIALRYGTVPVVRKTGGLTDTVQDYNPRTGRGTGFVFEDYTAQALVEGLERALALYRRRKEWSTLMRAGMKQDFSWERSATEYEKVYRKAMRKSKL
jgi:starch synthase